MYCVFITCGQHPCLHSQTKTPLHEEALCKCLLSHFFMVWNVKSAAYVPFQIFQVLFMLLFCLFSLNRKGLVTRAVNSTESSMTLWSRVETSQGEMALEVSWPPSPAERCSYQDVDFYRLVSARTNMPMTVCLEHILTWRFVLFKILAAVYLCKLTWKISNSTSCACLPSEEVF